MPTHLAAKRAPSVHGGFDFGLAREDGRITTRSTHFSESIEVSVRGQWVPVPAMSIHGYTVVMTGNWLKIASVHDEDWLEQEFDEPDPCLETLRALPGHRPDIFTFTQKVPSAVPRYKFPMEWDSIAVASFPSFDGWWNELPRETRKNVRRAQKRGVVLAIHEFNDELVRGIAAIQNECAIRQGRRYQHFGKTFDQVRRDHRSFIQRCDFITAHYENEIIGVLKLVYRGNVASIMQINSRVAHHDKRPANALLAKAVELCAQRGISHLVYGKYNYGNKDESGLREFKSRHAFHDLRMPRYYVPLTTWGQLCVKARLYRDLHQILPGPVIKTAVNLRAKWYERTTR
jgi:Acetyltransferase (GNAT) domain